MKNGHQQILLVGKAAGERVRSAHQRMRYLRTLEPSPAAPLTDEDLAIVTAAAGRRGDQFMHYMRSSYLDYFKFFMGEWGKAHDEALRSLL